MSTDNYDDELLAEIRSASQTPETYIDNIAEDQAIKVLLLGENEFPDNPFRSVLNKFISRLKKDTFTHLALEWKSTLKGALTRFQNGGSIDDLANELYNAGYEKFFLSDSPQDRDTEYFNILIEARSKGLELVAVDEDPGNGGYTDRDGTMRTNITNLFSEPSSRVLFIGGSFHTYVRQPLFRGKFLSLAEQLSAAGRQIFSIIGLTANDLNSPNGFRRLVMGFCPLRNWPPFAVQTSNCAPLNDLICQYQARCAGGTCRYADGLHSQATSSCSRSRTACLTVKNEPRFPIRYGDWDGIVWTNA